MNAQEIKQKYCMDASLAKKSSKSLEYFKKNGTKILNALPKGWKWLEGAMTAPSGYRWASNGESRFGGKYQNALVKV